MKKLLFILLFFTKISSAQSFVIDTADIIQHQLIFDTSRLFQNEDMFVMQNLVFFYGTGDGAEIITNGKCRWMLETHISLVSKKNTIIKLEKVKVGNIIYGKKSGYPVLYKVEKFKEFYELDGSSPVKMNVSENNINLHENKGFVDIVFYYKVGNRRKKLKINEVKVEYPLFSWAYFKERRYKWKKLYNQN